MNTRNRPINLDLTKFHFPVTAIASITHRITGIVLFAGTSFLLYALAMAVESEKGFNHVRDVLLASYSGRFVVWALLAVLAYHTVAGIKHVILESGYGESLVGGRRAAWLTFGCSAVLVILAGIWVWPR